MQLLSIQAQAAPTWPQWVALNWPLLVALNELRGLWTVLEVGHVIVPHVLP